jgi:hypothetical protein
MRMLVDCNASKLVAGGDARAGSVGRRGRVAGALGYPGAQVHVLAREVLPCTW